MSQGKITKEQIADKDAFGNLSEGAKESKALVDALNLALKATIETAKIVKSTSISGDPTGNKSIQERNTLLKTSNTLVQTKVRTEKQLQTARLSELKLQKDREKAFDRFEKKRKASIKTTEKERLAQLKLSSDREKAFKKADTEEKKSIKTSQKLRQETIKEANAYVRLNKQVNNARDRFRRLAVQHGVNSKAAQIASERYERLNRRLLEVNRTVKRSSGALSRFGSTLKGVLVAGGVIGVIHSIGRAFGNAFERIREFDKEMQNLAGISGKTRSELASTEKTIINVAGQSIRTSNEVAKLATSLFALGKSQKDVERLLKPANDLSIALGATSDEAGELLVSTLNAFQKGADSGEHFADVIAKMRTSTSLDFERIKDSLGFVAATANVMNLTIGETGALIGVLQDNGFKAARAGRLLNSSFIKLAKQGKTLEGSLDRINEAQERGATSMEILQIAGEDF